MDDLDDLFREAPPAAQTHPLGIRDRIDELRKIGCCDKLTWAPSGVLAYIAEDKTNVRFMSFRYKEREGRWSPKHTMIDPLAKQIAAFLDGSQLRHISFNPNGTGNELVVIDVFGRILCTAPLQTSFNRMTFQYAFSSAKNDLNRVVGMHWLTPRAEIQIGTPFHRETHKQGSSWTYNDEGNLPAFGPCNPFPGGPPHSTGRPAFVTVTTSGKLILYYAKSDAKVGSWDSLAHELFQFENSSLALTHAAICCVPSPNQNKSFSGELWVATIDTSHQIHVRAVQLRWQTQQAQQQGQQQGQQQQQQPPTATPHLSHVSLATLPFLSSSLSNGVPDMGLPTEVSFMRLILDRTAAPEERGIIRLLVGCHGISDAEQGLPTGHQAGTVISQYDFRMKKPEVDACWASLASKQTPRNPARDQLYIHRLSDESFSGIVLDLREHRYGSMFALAYSDGKIEYRNKDLNIPPLGMSTDSVAGLPAIGFSFTGGEPCLYNAASLNACVRATMNHNHSIKVQPIQASVPLMEVTDPEFKTKAGAVFALELLNAPLTNEIVDLVVAMHALTQQLPPDQAEIFRTIVLHHYGGPGTQLTGKLAEGWEKIIGQGPVHQKIHRLLSVQEALGHFDASKGRSSASLAAWILLNVRQCWITIATGLAPLGADKSKPRMAQPEIGKIVGNCVRWFTALIDWLVEQILLTNRSINFPKNFNPTEISFSFAELPAKVAPNTHVACALLGTPFARSLLKSTLTRVIHLQTRVYGTIDPQDLGPEWAPFQAAEDEAVVSTHEFSKFLNSCETAWTKIHKETAGQGGPGPHITEPMLRGLEARVLETGRLDHRLNITFLAQLVTMGAWNLRGCCEEARLAFRDYTLLEFGADTAAREFRARWAWDVARKKVIGERGRDGRMLRAANVPVKVCMRCGALTEDSVHGSMALVGWANTVDHHCVCGGHWVSEQQESGQAKGDGL